MLSFFLQLTSLLVVTSIFGDGAPLMAMPLDMWTPDVFPSGVPRLSPKLAKVAAQLDKRGKPPVMQDLTQYPNTLDMDDEFRVPQLAQFAIRTDESGTDNAKVEGKGSDKTVDRILIDRPMHPPDSSLLYGGYGQSGLVTIPVVQGVYQARAYVPVVVPVMQQPVVQVPQAVAVVQPQLIQTSQQTSMLATQQVLTQQSDSMGTVPQSVGSQQLAQPQQSRMTIPQTVAQSQPVVQPQPVFQPQPDVQPQPVIQSQPAVPSQVRMALPTGTNTVSANGVQPSGGQSQVRQGTVQSQSSITIRHQVVPHHIHITIPKSRQRMKPGYYVYSGSY
ncbi:hypothetical protein P879_09610 [Paragonimus westermani]|uniref:Uncharacterized protein n=1 Tax=Paragonimus westermani TaxID=34504 RepID=A0A8T0D1L8_9TREM|nr:hypothetical protein P879_09610 [Paragonimus westermani]